MEPSQPTPQGRPQLTRPRGRWWPASDPVVQTPLHHASTRGCTPLRSRVSLKGFCGSWRSSPKPSLPSCSGPSPVSPRFPRSSAPGPRHPGRTDATASCLRSHSVVASERSSLPGVCDQQLLFSLARLSRHGPTWPPPAARSPAAGRPLLVNQQTGTKSPIPQAFTRLTSSRILMSSCLVSQKGW